MVVYKIAATILNTDEEPHLRLPGSYIQTDKHPDTFINKKYQDVFLSRNQAYLASRGVLVRIVSHNFKLFITYLPRKEVLFFSHVIIQFDAVIVNNKELNGFFKKFLLNFT